MTAVRVLLVVATTFVGLAGIGPAVGGPAGWGGGGGSVGSPGGLGAWTCIAHRPAYHPGHLEVEYANGCTGHDEPEIDPVSTVYGSGQNLTWTVVLPSDGTRSVADVGPTFWFGGTVNDSHASFGQAFFEMQFYPDAVVKGCGAGGGYRVHHVTNAFSVCDPVWKLIPGKRPGAYKELAAFNGMLTNASRPGHPLVLMGGDTITVHWYVTSARDGYHGTVADVTRGTSGTIVLNSSTDGPLLPPFARNAIGNALAWGAVNDTPNSFVWEIGHTSNFASPPGQFCSPGQTICDSYNQPSWAGTNPIRILSVTFPGGATAKEWAVVSDLGGKAEVRPSCGGYGGPYCIYPWYTEGSNGFHYGVDFKGTSQNFGRADEFAQSPLCGGPFGANSTYCDTVVVP